MNLYNLRYSHLTFEGQVEEGAVANGEGDGRRCLLQSAASNARRVRCILIHDL